MTPLKPPRLRPGDLIALVSPASTIADPLRIDRAVRYLESLGALAAYNAGPERVAEYRGVPPYQETRTIIDRVLSYYRQFNSSLK